MMFFKLIPPLEGASLTAEERRSPLRTLPKSETAEADRIDVLTLDRMLRFPMAASAWSLILTLRCIASSESLHEHRGGCRAVSVSCLALGFLVRVPRGLDVAVHRQLRKPAFGVYLALFIPRGQDCHVGECLLDLKGARFGLFLCTISRVYGLVCFFSPR